MSLRRPFCVFLLVYLLLSSASFFVQFIEQGKWRSRGLCGLSACSMPPFCPHRAGEMPFYATVGPISLLDVLHERSPCASLSRSDNMATFWSSLFQGDYTSSGMSLLRSYVFAGDYFYWEFGALLRHTPLTGGFAPICGERGISHASRAFSLAARRGGPCKVLIIRSYATESRYFISGYYLTRASS